MTSATCLFSFSKEKIWVLDKITSSRTMSCWASCSLLLSMPNASSILPHHVVCDPGIWVCSFWFQTGFEPKKGSGFPLLHSKDICFVAGFNFQPVFFIGWLVPSHCSQSFPAPESLVENPWGYSRKIHQKRGFQGIVSSQVMQNTKHKDCFTVVLFSEKVNTFGQKFPSMKVCFRMMWRIPLTLDSPKWNHVWVHIVCWKRDQRNKSSRPNFNLFGLF